MPTAILLSSPQSLLAVRSVALRSVIDEALQVLDKLDQKRDERSRATDACRESSFGASFSRTAFPRYFQAPSSKNADWPARQAGLRLSKVKKSNNQP